MNAQHSILLQSQPLIVVMNAFHMCEHDRSTVMFAHAVEESAWQVSTFMLYAGS